MGCQLILFLFDCISLSEYFLSKHQIQRLNFSIDEKRTFMHVPNVNDPSYYIQNEAGIKA